MKWAYPLDPGQITGRQTLTADKPITLLHRAVRELQDAVVAGASITVNGVPASCQIVGNKLVAVVDIPVGSDIGDVLPDGTAANQVLVWTGTAWIADYVRAV